MGNRCGRRYHHPIVHDPQEVPARLDRQARQALPDPQAHNPQRERAIVEHIAEIRRARPRVHGRGRWHLRKVLLTVLKLKRLRWLQALVRCSLNSMKVKNSPHLQQRFRSLLGRLTRMIAGTASWFNHLIRIQGRLYFVGYESELAEFTYRRRRLGLTNY